VSKYNGPVCRHCRRELQKLFLKGDRCFTDRCAFDRKGYPPGQHGQKRGKVSEYGVQLREKQKVRKAYGMTEQSFRNLYAKAVAERGVTSEVFFQKLEMRLDNVIYRMGFARSRQEAKQVVRHNHILVNGKKVNIPSAQTKIGDVVTVSTGSRKMSLFALAADLFGRRAKIPWVEVDLGQFSGKVVALPLRDDIQMNVKERLIVELYSK